MKAMPLAVPHPRLRRRPRAVPSGSRCRSTAPGRSRTASRPSRRRRCSARPWPCPASSTTRRRRFPDVDAFDSLELVNNKIAQKLLPESARVAAPGVSRQERNYFWYRRTFTAPARKAVATLRVNKAQFGTAVWLNGTKVGEYAGCFSAGVFDVTASHEVGGRERAARPHRRAPGRPARDVPGGDRLREAEVDARHLRRGLAAARGQPGDRERPGGPARRVAGDPRRDEARESRAATR